MLLAVFYQVSIAFVLNLILIFHISSNLCDIKHQKYNLALFQKANAGKITSCKLSRLFIQ